MQKSSELIHRRLHLMEFLSVFFALSCGILIFSLMVLTNVFSFSFTTSLATYTKKGNAFGKLYELSNQNFVGEIRILPHDYSSTLIQGEVKGLSPGHSYSILILENSNFLIDELKQEKFYHLNPTKSEAHSCKNVLSENKGHKGDLGNIIASSNGVASIEILVKNLNYIELLGRSFVVLNHEDKCDNHSPSVSRDEIMVYSVIALYSDNLELEEFEKNLEKKKIQHNHQLEKIESEKKYVGKKPEKSIFKAEAEKKAEEEEPKIFAKSNLRNLEPVPLPEEHQEIQEAQKPSPIIEPVEEIHHEEVPHEEKKSSTPKFNAYKTPEYVNEEPQYHHEEEQKPAIENLKVENKVKPNKKLQEETFSTPSPKEGIDDHDSSESFFDSPIFNQKSTHNTQGNMNRSPPKKLEEDDGSQNFMDSIFGPLMKEAEESEKKPIKVEQIKSPAMNHHQSENSSPKLFHGIEPTPMPSMNNGDVEGLEGIRDENPSPFDLIRPNNSDDDDEPSLEKMQSPVIVKKNHKGNEMNFKELMFNAQKRNELKNNLTNIITSKFDLPISSSNANSSDSQDVSTKKNSEITQLSKNFENHVKRDMENHLKKLEPHVEYKKPESLLPVDPILLLDHHQSHL